MHLLAVQAVKRDLVYGLAFYRNQPIVEYGLNGYVPPDKVPVTGIPDAEHILVLRTRDTDQLPIWLAGRVYEPLFLYEPQGLAVYKVYAKPPQPQLQSQQTTTP